MIFLIQPKLPLLSELLHQSLHFRDWSCWHYSLLLLLLSSPPSLPLRLLCLLSLSLCPILFCILISAYNSMCMLVSMGREQDERKWPFHSLHFPLTPTPPITTPNPQQAHSPAQFNSGSGLGIMEHPEELLSCPVSFLRHIHTCMLKSRLSSV